MELSFFNWRHLNKEVIIVSCFYEAMFGESFIVFWLNLAQQFSNKGKSNMSNCDHVGTKCCFNILCDVSILFNIG